VSVPIAILTFALIAVVVFVVSAPLRAARGRDDRASAHAGELEAAREAKYREIRDAELDYRTGKLSREDYEAVDRTLRAEAVEILNRIESRHSGAVVAQVPDPGGEAAVRARESDDASA
jgi:hypothetical protein